MQLLQRIDHRSPLQKATRDELVAYAVREGQVDIHEQMTKPEIIEKLTARGLTNIKIHDRPLGVPHTVADYGLIDDPAPKSSPKTTVLLTPTDPERMSIQQLRVECRRLGIKMERTDNLKTLKDKIRGQNAA